MTLTAADLAALSRLLDEVIDLNGAEREAWLAALSEADVHLAPTLRDMLAERDSTRRLDLPSVAPAVPVKDEAVATPGELVGPYRLIREIGRGGMGAVWLAERADGAFKRQVALKLPRLAWGVGLAERMARERKIGALLEHPNIARLYDAGVDDRGRPYLALEYIAGEAIETWCRDKTLSVRERLKLIVQVARAVSYAHGRLVVHRDLKPSNVLVTEDGQTHLLDFGIAKLLHEAGARETGLTQDLGRVLTPHFASPEQMRGEAITVQSDVYSLGVLLYELLTGNTPYRPKRNTLGALEEAILEGEPAPASSRTPDKTTAKALRTEVDAILAKSLRREPAQRYATTDALADDIERYLAGETVRARPDSQWYRLRKVIGRNRIGFAASAAVLAAVTAGSVATFIQTQRAARQAERARVITWFVSEIFRASANPAAVDRLEASQAHPLSLDRNARLIETRFADQPEVQAELYGVVGQIYLDIGVGNLALLYALRQVKALEQQPTNRERLGRALMLLTEANSEEGHFADAEASARRAADLLNVDTPLGLEARGLLAQMLFNNAKLDEARSIVSKGEETIRSASGAGTVGAAQIAAVKAQLLQVDNRFDEAWPAYASAIATALSAEGPSSRFANRLRIVMATYMAARGRGQEGARYLEDAQRSLSATGDAGRVQAALATARWWKLLYFVAGTSYRDAHERITAARATVAPWGSSLPERVLAEFDWSLGFLELRYGNVMAASQLMPEAVPILRTATDNLLVRWEIAAASGLLAMKLGRHDEADALLREAIHLRSQSGRRNVPFAANGWFFAARNLLMRGDAKGAEQLLQQAPAFAPLRGAKVPTRYADMVPFGLAEIRFERGDVAGALATLPPTYGTSAEWDQGNDQAPFALRGEIQCRSGHPHEGLRTLTASIDGVAQVVSENDPGLARTRAVAGLCALKLGDHKVARQLVESSRRAFEAQPDVSPWYKAPLAELDRALGTTARPT